MTGLITVVMGPVLLCPDVRHGLCDKSVSEVACKSGAVSLAAFSAAAWVHGCMRGC